MEAYPAIHRNQTPNTSKQQRQIDGEG